MVHLVLSLTSTAAQFTFCLCVYPALPKCCCYCKAEASGNASHEKQLLHYSKACVQPVYNFFYFKFNNDLKPVLDSFKAARLFSPFKFHKLKPSATDTGCLKAFPFLSSQKTIDGTKMEISMYVATSEDVSTEIDGGRDMLLSFLNGPMLLKRYY